MSPIARRHLIAIACHQAWYAYTVLALREEGEPWESAPDWQKASILDAVDFWDTRMEEYTRGSERFEHPDDGAEWDDPNKWARKHLPRMSHHNWMKHKTAEGWVYGEAKDPEKKTHPCMVPYGDLDEAQKIKDAVVVEAYIAMRDALKLAVNAPETI